MNSQVSPVATDLTPAADPGPDLYAVDYRVRPSASQSEFEGSRGFSREAPNAGGMPVGPMPDRDIHFYDLPEESAGYDRMGKE